MGIRISNFLITSAVFLHFGGSNAMYRGSGSKVGGKGLIAVHKPEGTPQVTVFYGYTPIQLWLNDEGKILHAYFENCHLPQAVYYRYNDFLIRHVTLNGHEFVAYVGDEGKLIGVRPPELASGNKVLNPTPTEWYMIHDNKKFRLHVNPREKKVFGIELMTGNFIDHETNVYLLANVANIRFKVFGDREGRSTGAELIEDYYYNVG